ncbi:TetR/AcrR family transcriptional regulator [Gordonia sp. CPCC 205515]|uniref:TetR/AcrR family transcriptional regulator n=1 Tax=Gordonia sp. CPCC 205515 TaxID=3140791 RepID=UPI003AF3C3B1
MTSDWLIGNDRSDRARERLYSLATELIARNGVDGLDIDELARRAHCSRATIYRHTGGKRQIVEAVLTRTSAQIVGTVRSAIDGATGRKRTELAILTALEAIRGDPITRRLLRSPTVVDEMRAVTGSAVVRGAASDLMGLDSDDDATVSFAVRSVVALVVWPADDEQQQVRMLIGALG